jgi:ABC-type transport system involved in multi-copper enzyme maturation permease subunit
MPIFDQGYQHWQGPLSGHAWRWLAIARHGVRVQAKNRILRFLVLLSWIPALGLVAVVALWGLVEQQNATVTGLLQSMLPGEMMRDPAAYRITVWTVAYSYFFQFQIYLIMLLVVIAGPGLISRDLRFNALPLYFARPLTRLDYFAGKLGVIGALVAAVAVVPALCAYLIGVCFSLDVSVVRDTYPVLLGSVAYGLVVTLSTGTLMLAMSSLTRRSLYVGFAWAGLWIISGSVGGILSGVHGDAVRRGTMNEEIQRFVDENPPPPGVQMHGMYPSTMRHPMEGMPAGVSVRRDPNRQVERWHRAWSLAAQKGYERGQQQLAEEARTDWRPLCSYVGNLGRLADLLLDTDGAWVAFGKASTARGPGRGGPRSQTQAAVADERRFADQMVPQYPWWWSAAVLAGLVGLSTCILTLRVTSLDRLK